MGVGWQGHYSLVCGKYQLAPFAHERTAAARGLIDYDGRDGRFATGWSLWAVQAVMAEYIKI